MSDPYHRLEEEPSTSYHVQFSNNYHTRTIDAAKERVGKTFNHLFSFVATIQEQEKSGAGLKPEVAEKLAGHHEKTRDKLISLEQTLLYQVLNLETVPGTDKLTKKSISRLNKELKRSIDEASKVIAKSEKRSLVIIATENNQSLKNRVNELSQNGIKAKFLRIAAKIYETFNGTILSGLFSFLQGANKAVKAFDSAKDFIIANSMAGLPKPERGR